LRTSLSVPLVVDDELIGVLTLYSATERFSDNHRLLVETASRHIARRLQHHRVSVAVRA
jgi:GAF domain-containing protein